MIVLTFATVVAVVGIALIVLNRPVGELQSRILRKVGLTFVSVKRARRSYYVSGFVLLGFSLVVSAIWIYDSVRRGLSPFT